MDGSEEYMAFVRAEALYWRHDLTAVGAFITRENIDQILRNNGFAGQIGLSRLQMWVEGLNISWMQRFPALGFNQKEQGTAIGQIGNLKLSGRIVLRIETAGQAPPGLISAQCNQDSSAIVADILRRHGDWAARCPAVVPAILPNTAPFIRPVPPG